MIRLCVILLYFLCLDVPIYIDMLVMTIGTFSSRPLESTQPLLTFPVFEKYPFAVGGGRWHLNVVFDFPYLVRSLH